MPRCIHPPIACSMFLSLIVVGLLVGFAIGMGTTAPLREALGLPDASLGLGILALGTMLHAVLVCAVNRSRNPSLPCAYGFVAYALVLLAAHVTVGIVAIQTAGSLRLDRVRDALEELPDKVLPSIEREYQCANVTGCSETVSAVVSERLRDQGIVSLVGGSIVFILSFWTEWSLCRQWAKDRDRDVQWDSQVADAKRLLAGEP